jgi:hypothetical protein
MQAGLTTRRLTLREIFSSRMGFLASKNVIFALFDSAPSASLAAPGNASGGLTTFDDGSTRSAEYDRKIVKPLSLVRPCFGVGHGTLAHSVLRLI